MKPIRRCVASILQVLQRTAHPMSLVFVRLPYGRRLFPPYPHLANLKHYKEIRDTIEVSSEFDRHRLDARVSIQKHHHAKPLKRRAIY